MAEKDKDTSKKIKDLSFDSKFLEGIFGKMTRYVEKDLTYEEAINYSSSDSNEEENGEDRIEVTSNCDQIHNITRYREADLNKRKEAFICWFLNQVKPKDESYGGKPYSRKVIEQYAKSLEDDATKLIFPQDPLGGYDGYDDVKKNLFEFSDLIVFWDAMRKIKTASNYDQINKYRINKGFSPAMDQYCAFLFYLYKNDPKNPLDEYNFTPPEIVRKTCLDLKLPARERRLHKLNTIIYGAPGTGKTYSTAERALAIVENKTVEEIKKEYNTRADIMNRYRSYVASGRIVFTTFHQNYGYEEFIQGLRPDDKKKGIAFRKVDGVFKTIADQALHDCNNDYVIIIDEINRANISKVFGELITLIEEDKRWGEENQLSVLLQLGDYFAVPNNLYIIGTMNSADKSISLIDAALRRRFYFEENTPNYELVTDKNKKEILTEINKYLVAKLDSTDLLVGHSYFMGNENGSLCEIINNKIIPLLYEYFYDQRSKVYDLLKNVIELSSAPLVLDEYDDKTKTVGRLRVKEKKGY